MCVSTSATVRFKASNMMQILHHKEQNFFAIISCQGADNTGLQSQIAGDYTLTTAGKCSDIHPACITWSQCGQHIIINRQILSVPLSNPNICVVMWWHESRDTRP